MKRVLAQFRRNVHRHKNSWLLFSTAAAGVLLLPILAVLAAVFAPPTENWAHVTQFLLRDYVFHSALLVLFAGIGSVAVGASLAWLVAAFDFPGKAFFRWALLLPLAVPPYIAAFTYASMTSYTGIVQKTLRAAGFTPAPGAFNMMNLPGAVFIFVLYLYPYVYMLTRSFLERQSGSYVENARLLGRSSAGIFFSVALPLARPAIAGGAMLVAFEVLSDYGVANYYGIPTFTTAIFTTWFGLYDLASATKLAAWFMLGILAILLLERRLRGNRRYSATTGKASPLAAFRLSGWKAALAAGYCLAVLAVAFLAPVAQLLVWARWTFADVALNANFLQLTVNTVKVAVPATLLIMVLAVLLAGGIRTLDNRFGYALARLMTIGYAIPGAIIAIGVLSLTVAADRLLAPLYRLLGLGDAPLVLSLSAAMLVFAYVIRFLATGYNAVEAGYEKIGPKYAESARLLGLGMTAAFFRAEFPLLKGALLGGMILTFVEVAKELPLALLLRPFNFDTLATKAYQYASDERIFSAAAPSLFIIAVSLVSIVLLHNVGRRGETG